jgi:putative spermidine/putrescine transport system ATP-binding protein
VGAAERGLDATIEMVLPLGPLVVFDVVLSDGTALKVTVGRGVGVAPHGPGARVRVGLAPGAPAPVFAEGRP